jgi:hypothetical protein
MPIFFKINKMRFFFVGIKITHRMENKKSKILSKVYDLHHLLQKIIVNKQN